MPITTDFSLYTRASGLISYTAATRTYSVFAPHDIFQKFIPAARASD